MSNPYELGPLPDDGTRGYRVEIDEFVENNEMTNLFLLALSNLQKGSLDPVKDSRNNDIPNWLNYYAAASIHGRPTEEWKGLKNPLGGYGYCHHARDTFPIWHRPYMAFYESVIYREMARIADQYPVEQERKTYQAAAARFRLPFWDLVMPRNEYKEDRRIEEVWGTPALLKTKTVYVKLPKPTPNAVGGFDTISNPLYTFTLPTPAERKAANEKLGRNVLVIRGKSNIRTVRTPSSTDETDDQRLNDAISLQASTHATLLMQMLNPDHFVAEVGRERDPNAVKIAINEVRDWRAFANHSSDETVVNGKTYPTGSIESWHDGIHIFIGSGLRAAGHMGDAAVAAFDPVFWLHHNNIERLLCLHQAIYPTKYVEGQIAVDPLAPFLRQGGNGVCWNPSDKWIKDYWNSGFATPGAKQPKGDFADIRRELVKYLAKTYVWAANRTAPTLEDWPRNLTGSWALHGPSASPRTIAPVVQISALSTSSGRAQLVTRKIARVAHGQPAQAATEAPVDVSVSPESVLQLMDQLHESLPTGALEDSTNANKPTYQVTWNAHIKVRKYAFGESFAIHLFIGRVNDEKSDRFMTRPNEVGFTGVFVTSQDGIEGCSNCVRQREEDIIVEDTTPMTTILYDYLSANPISGNLIQTGENRTIENLSVEQVVPFLTENLQWRMTDLAGNLLTDFERSGLEILISHRTYLAPDQDHLLGQYGPYVPHPDITSGRPGGWRSAVVAA